MKIAIYCGCFNPPHIGHYELATALLTQNYAQKVVVVPTGDFYNKASLISATHRIAMLQKMFQNNPNITIDTFEIQPQAISTLQTIQHMRALYPKDELWLVIGADNYQEIPSWSGFDALRESTNFLVVERKGYTTPPPLPNTHTQIVNLHVQEISSTIIRTAIAQNNTTYQKFLQEPICAYIQEHHLYFSTNQE